MRFNFSIYRPDQTPFDGLTADYVQAWVAGNSVLKDLESTNTSGNSVILLIDGSGSMALSRHSAGATHLRRANQRSQRFLKPQAPTIQGIDKLSAAKSAIYDFLDHLQPNDRVAIFAFDAQQKSIYSISNNKAGAKAAVARFQTVFPSAQYTALYDSMEFAVKRAGILGVRNVVFLTDGMEDTREFRRFSSSRKMSYRRAREQQITDLAIRNGNTRIYTIAIGDRNAKPGSLVYVDFETLTRITDRTNAGRSHYVDLPDLARKARDSSSQYHAALVRQLTDILADISKSFHYDYTLTLRPDRSYLVQDGKPRTVRVECTVGEVKLPVEFTYTWAEGDDSPEFGPAQVMAALFIPPVDQRIGLGPVTWIYLLLLLLLAALTTIPFVFRRVERIRLLSIAQDSVVTVDGRSSLIGKECPNERNLMGRDYLIRKGDPVVVCPECRTPHHLSCWHMSQDTCWVRTCQHYVALSDTVLQAHGVEK